MKSFTNIYLLVFCLVFCGSVVAQPVKEPVHIPSEWTLEKQPFCIVGNLYYVGTADLASYLITSDQGHILINTGVASSAGTIRKNVESLGFKFSDIKILLATHAHYDHVGAMAAIKKMTGAIFLIHKNDAAVMEDGGKSDYVFGGDTSSFEPVKVDSFLKDGDKINLGNSTITVLHHPGHTKGACSFMCTINDDKGSHKVLIANMPSIVFDEPFSELKTYPDAQKDYAATFKKMKVLKFDYWVASHASQFDLDKKHPEGSIYNPAAFADRKGYDAEIKELYAKFLKKLRQRS